MVTVVVPFRGKTAKSRLCNPELAAAMLGDVLRAAQQVGEVVVANGEGGQGAAVMEALAHITTPVVIVNADLPCVTPDDLRALIAATPDSGFAIVRAHDGTTNALSLSRPDLFEPLYGAGSADRYLDRGAVAVSIPNLEDDVDTIDDLERVRERVGTETQGAL